MVKGGGHVWWGMCVEKEGHAWLNGVCVAGGMHGMGHA